MKGDLTMIERQSVNILVRHVDGRALLQFRDGRAPTSPLSWGLWGGAFEASETDPTDCAVRELSEELSIYAMPGDFTKIGKRRSSNQIAWLMLYMLTVDWSDIDLKEGAGAGFLWHHEILKLQQAKHLAEILERFGRHFS